MAISEQDLAKLVLGYLAEQQLMTAYDEFLHASPHLDALHNEYGRFYMTSLRNILTEYGALRILVETCQPLQLRAKLMQCSNLPDTVKFLINNVDYQKVVHTGLPRGGALRVATSVPRKVCDTCRLRLDTCVCNSKSVVSHVHHQSSEGSFSNLDTLVEATALADLPGNMQNQMRKKQIRGVSGETPQTQHKEIDHTDSVNVPGTPAEACSRTHLDGSVQNACNLSMRTSITPKNTSATNICESQAGSRRRSAGSGFKDFVSGVTCGPKVNISVPDSSTTDNLNKTTKKDDSLQSNKKSRAQSAQHEQSYPVIAPKTNDVKRDEQKITILSDIKVNNSAAVSSMPTTIVINGTPAYKPDYNIKKNFSKDEIMSMPTIILVPHTGSLPVTSEASVASTASIANTASIASCPPATVSSGGGPAAPGAGGHDALDRVLSADVSAHMPEIDGGGGGGGGGGGRNASMPKQGVAAPLCKTSTPQALPPPRRSSSTPRRSSHVRALDFATPRRVLLDPAAPPTPSAPSTPAAPAAPAGPELLVSRSPGLGLDVIPEASPASGHDSSKENCTAAANKKASRNWDADLRALIAGDKKNELLTNSISKRKPPKKKKSESGTATTPKPDSKPEGKKASAKKAKRSPDPKSCKKKKEKPVETESLPVVVPEAAPVVEAAVKPTINIVTDWSISSKEEDKTANKSSEVQGDTPDMDRISIQNVIGAKLNISDLLETPYKQAIYDIQMETPRFFQPYLPGDPVSEIKISDIPTPRFLSTPGATHATPSSYTSRGTDYSSGGSYYKPDENDFQPAPELQYAVKVAQAQRRVADTTSAAPDPAPGPAPDPGTAPDPAPASSAGSDTPDTKANDKRTSRPVRQCTKNVSYYDSASKNSEKKIDADTSSDSLALRIEVSEEDGSSVNSKDSKPKPKDERRKSTTQRKSLVKKTPNKFMKIKPRQSPKAQRRKSKKGNESLSTSRSRRRSKDKLSNTPVSAAPTKSRRKSSTPRKLHKSPYSSSSGNDVSQDSLNRSKEINKFTAPSTHESDNEHLPLRWSDEGSRGSHDPAPSAAAASSAATAPSAVPSAAPAPAPFTAATIASKQTSEAEDISQIREFIAATGNSITTKNVSDDIESLHIDLVKRGFDIETAKKIERDLLDAPPTPKSSRKEIIETIKILGSPIQKISNEPEPKAEQVATGRQSQPTQEEEDEVQEIELSVNECDESSSNYRSVVYDHTDTKIERSQIHKIKDTFSMEIDLEDEVIRLRTTTQVDLFDLSPAAVMTKDHEVETEAAVNSISGIDRLYTPMKDDRDLIHARTCMELFDSTLGSLDTPLKANTPRRSDVTVSEIVLEVEKVDEYEATHKTKKRKRVCSGSGSDDSQGDSKKNKKDARLLPSIQNFDIESVLSKLHGP